MDLCRRGGRGVGREEDVRDGGEGGGEGEVIYAEAEVDGGREDVAVEEDGDVEEEVVLVVGSLGGLDVDVCEEGLHLEPGRRWGRDKEDDDERVRGGGGGGCDGGVEVVRGVEGVEGGDEESALDRHRGNK